MKRVITYLLLALSLSKLSAESSFLDGFAFKQHLHFTNTFKPNFKYQSSHRLKLGDLMPSAYLGLGDLSSDLSSKAHSLQHSWSLNLFYTDVDFAHKFHLKENLRAHAHGGMKTYSTRLFDGLTLGVELHF